MKNQNNYISRAVRNNRMELTKAENITKEIAEEIRYKLHNDGLILL